MFTPRTIAVVFAFAAACLQLITAQDAGASTTTSAIDDAAADVNAPILASPMIRLGDATFFGSGCPNDTVRVVPSSDGQTVSVLFSSYVAKTDGSTTRDRKSCNLAVPVDVNAGFRVGIVQVDYRGYATVPRIKGASAAFNAEYFFATTQGPKQAKSYAPGFDGDVFLSDKVTTITWSLCGASSIFRVNTAITATKLAARHKDVSIAVDTADATTKRRFTYYLKYERC